MTEDDGCAWLVVWEIPARFEVDTTVGDLHPTSVTSCRHSTSCNRLHKAFKRSGVIGDTVWYDADEDGTQGSGAIEPGIGGVDLTVLWAGWDGVVGTVDDIDFGTQTTDGLGYYLFTELPHGTFLVTIGGIPFPYSYFGPANIRLTLDAVVAGAGLTADFPLVLAATPPEELPFTGFRSGAALLLAAFLLGLGSLMVGATRRREDELG